MLLLCKQPMRAPLSSLYSFLVSRPGSGAMSASASGASRAGSNRPGPPPRKLFKLQGPGVLAISGGDLTKWKGDAIVNAANERMLGGGGVDGAIHRVAGRQLMEACYNVPVVPKSRYIRCPTGEARITPGFRLDAKYVIHTVGPIYESSEESAPLLRSAIKNSLLLCKSNGLKSIAFPAISCGVYGYPPHEAAEVAIDVMLEFSDGIDLIEFVLFGMDTFEPFVSKASEKLDVVDQEPDSKADESDDKEITGEAESNTEGKEAANAAAKPSPAGQEGVSATAEKGTAPTESSSEENPTAVEPMSQEEIFGGLDGSIEAAGDGPTSRENKPGEHDEADDTTADAEPMSQSVEEDAAHEKVQETASSAIAPVGEQELPGRKRPQPGAEGDESAGHELLSSGDRGVPTETDDGHNDSGASGEGKAEGGGAGSGTCDSSASIEGPSA